MVDVTFIIPLDNVTDLWHETVSTIDAKKKKELENIVP